MARSKASFGSARIEQYYNKIVILFIVLTVLLLLAIVYFSFAKTTIVVHAQPVEQTIEIITNLSQLEGVTLVTSVEGSKTFTEVTSQGTKPGKASGTVKIVNTYNKSQPLVATTRLLSKEGVLFRTQETVTVPAGGSVEVPVSADQEGAEGNIGPSTFEIVALWEGLKKDIYAESSSPMTGGVMNVAVTTEKDIANAVASLQEELLTSATTRFEEELLGEGAWSKDAVLLGPSSYVVKKDAESSSAAAGESVDQLEVTEKLTVTAPVVSKRKLLDAVQANIQEEVSANMALAEPVTFEDLTIEVSDLSAEGTEGKLTLTAMITATIGAEHPLLDRKNLVNKSENEVKKYLEAFEEVESVDVRFSPFWVKKTPSLVDHISISVE